MIKPITCTDLFVPRHDPDWDNYKECCRQVRISRLTHMISEIFKGVLAVSLIVGGGLFMGFLSTSTAVLLPISISFAACGAAALIASIALRCLSQRHLKGYTVDSAVVIASDKLLKMIKKLPGQLDDSQWKEKNKRLRMKTNAPIPHQYGLVTRYDWHHSEKMDRNALTVRTFRMKNETIVNLLEAAFEKNLLLKFYRFRDFALGKYPPKTGGKDAYKEACLETDTYAAQFAARILAKDPDADLKRLNTQLDSLRQTCRNNASKRCPLVFEIKKDNGKLEIVLKKREFQHDIDKYKEIFTDEGLQVVEVDVTVKPD